MNDVSIKIDEKKAPAHGFMTVHVHVPKVVACWRGSIRSFEWLDSDGNVKTLEALSPVEAHKREAVEDAIASGQAVPRPVLGIGIQDNIEIGTGRAVLLTAAAYGIETLSVDIPKSNEAEFKRYLALQTDQSESGNVLFYVLIAVALLAALSFTIAESTRSSVSGMDEEHAALIATEIISIANNTTNAVAELRLQGCGEDQLSFATPKVAGRYANTKAPADQSCHIYGVSGGNLNYQPINSLADANTAAAWQITGDLDVEQIGTNCVDGTCNELLIIATNINISICEQINRLVLEIGSAGMPQQALATPTDFEGNYVYEDTIGDEGGSIALAGQRAGCFLDTSNSSYVFYRALLRR